MNVVKALFLCFLLSGCDIKEIPGEIPGNDPKPPATPTPKPGNPICVGIQEFGNGNLYKPYGDHSNTPVFLIKAAFVEPFISCEILLKGSQTAALRYTGMSNGDRQTWRLDGIPCEEVQGNGFIRCEEFKQTCRWDLPGRPCRRYD